eukprot:tig00000605_g2485.t1
MSAGGKYLRLGDEEEDGDESSKTAPQRPSPPPQPELDFQDFGTVNGAAPTGSMAAAPSSRGGMPVMPTTGLSYEPLGPQQPQQPQQAGVGSFLSISYYRPFFDIDTREILTRLTLALMPMKGGIYEGGLAAPDLYGPFWTCTTLIFLIGVCGNLVSRLSFTATDDKPNWEYDLTKMSVGMSVVYGYVGFVSAALWAYLRFQETGARFVETLSVYGYSLAVFVPIFILGVIPFAWLHWILILAGFCMSSYFLFVNMRLYLPAAPGARYMVLGACGACHFGLALAFKLYLFEV